MKNIRRYYSDVSSGNVGKMLFVKEVFFNLNLESIILFLLLIGGFLFFSRESSVEKEDVKINLIIITEVFFLESDFFSLSVSSLLLRRFVEGSDYIIVELVVFILESRLLGFSSESRKEEAEKYRRVKFFSVRVKDKFRVRFLRLYFL